jgi:hypothetical protein
MAGSAAQAVILAKYSIPGRWACTWEIPEKVAHSKKPTTEGRVWDRLKFASKDIIFVRQLLTCFVSIRISGFDSWLLFALYLIGHIFFVRFISSAAGHHLQTLSNTSVAKCGRTRAAGFCTLVIS